jgi:hypothetical protein
MGWDRWGARLGGSLGGPEGYTLQTIFKQRRPRLDLAEQEMGVRSHCFVISHLISVSSYLFIYEACRICRALP